MNTTNSFRDWSRSQQQLPVRPTFYAKKMTKDEEYPPLKTLQQPVKLRTELAPSAQEQGPASSDLGRQGPSLAARIANAIKVDEQNILSRRIVEEPKLTHEYTVLPISQYGRLKYLSQRKERAEREASVAADEHEYRWQISHEISREKFDREYGVEPMSLPDDLTDDNNETEDAHTDNQQINPIH